MSAAIVGDTFSRGWNSVRAQGRKDEIRTFHFSHGRKVSGVAADLPQILAEYWDLSAKDHALIDVAHCASWAGGNLVPDASSGFIGFGLRELIDSGAQKILIHLPLFARCSDAGLGMLMAFADDNCASEIREIETISLAERITNISDSLLAQAIANFREITKNTQIFITYSDALPLLGFSGMAKSWMNYGISAQSAQETEYLIGKIAGRIESLTAARRMLGVPRNMPFSGAGGGLAFLGSSLGITVSSLTDFLFAAQSYRESVKAAFAQSDLIFYICADLGAQIPAGLLRHSEIAAEAGVPFVLISLKSDLRKGDLPRLGLAGSYHLDSVAPEKSDIDPRSDGLPAAKSCSHFAANGRISISSRQGLVDYPGCDFDLSELVRQNLPALARRCAYTWGW
ncbi:hypothetical protein J2S36_000424 [Arcanobacterium hippocoleae]|uniref:Uncharacterized protein n=2 Tax=Arcanobacterium hippocoleae TaxID=149017 RepID=A0ABU1T1X2_9ACTO|nr:glycerate kinase [Arcanobacterium hippocoleae]MDR6938881.1 hypothetical protein [Arcanobacterium hippocoleae]